MSNKWILTGLIVMLGAIVPTVGNAADAAGKKVGLVWIDKAGNADNVAKGFTARMAEKAPTITVDAKINLPKDAAIKAYDEFQASADGVVFLRWAGAQHMVKNAPKCPGFFGACNNPVELGAAKDLKAPGGNLTGVSYYIPAAKQFEIYKKIFPNLKTAAFLVDKSNPSGVVEATEVEAACKAVGVTYSEGVAATKDELVKAVSGLSGKCDLFIIGNQATIYDNGSAIAMLADKTPVMSLSEKPIMQKQALGGLVADNEKLGRDLADIVISVVSDGKKPGEIPVGLDSAPKFLLNSKKATELGVKIPEDVMKTAQVVE